MNKEIKKEQAEKVHGLIAAWLGKWIGPWWAKVIAAAVVGGAIAALGLSLGGCTKGSIIYEHPEYGRVVIFQGK